MTRRQTIVIRSIGKLAIGVLASVVLAGCGAATSTGTTTTAGNATPTASASDVAACAGVPGITPAVIEKATGLEVTRTRFDGSVETGSNCNYFLGDHRPIAVGRILTDLAGQTYFGMWPRCPRLIRPTLGVNAFTAACADGFAATVFSSGPGEVIEVDIDKGTVDDAAAASFEIASAAAAAGARKEGAGDGFQKCQINPTVTAAVVTEATGVDVVKSFFDKSTDQSVWNCHFVLSTDVQVVIMLFPGGISSQDYLGGFARCRMTAITDSLTVGAFTARCPEQTTTAFSPSDGNVIEVSYVDPSVSADLAHATLKIAQVTNG